MCATIVAISRQQSCFFVFQIARANQVDESVVEAFMERLVEHGIAEAFSAREIEVDGEVRAAIPYVAYAQFHLAYWALQGGNC